MPTYLKFEVHKENITTTFLKLIHNSSFPVKIKLMKNLLVP